MVDEATTLGVCFATAGEGAYEVEPKLNKIIAIIHIRASRPKKVLTQYAAVMGDFNAKVGTKQSRDHVIGNYGVGRRNNRGELLVQFAERNRIRIMNTFFKKHKNGKWTWKGPLTEKQ